MCSSYPADMSLRTLILNIIELGPTMARTRIYGPGRNGPPDVKQPPKPRDAASVTAQLAILHCLRQAGLTKRLEISGYSVDLLSNELPLIAATRKFVEAYSELSEPGAEPATDSLKCAVAAHATSRSAPVSVSEPPSRLDDAP